MGTGIGVSIQFGFNKLFKKHVIGEEEDGNEYYSLSTVFLCGGLAGMA
jgi:hypothetical protein